jgi:hypothetical protein
MFTHMPVVVGGLVCGSCRDLERARELELVRQQRREKEQLQQTMMELRIAQKQAAIDAFDAELQTHMLMKRYHSPTRHRHARFEERKAAVDQAQRNWEMEHRYE